MDIMDIGNNIKKMRRLNKLTQKQLAERLDVNINTVQNYENGRRKPSLEMIRKITEALQCAPMDIISFLDYEKLDEKLDEMQKQEISQKGIVGTMGKISGMLSSRVNYKDIENEVNNLFHLYKKRSSLDILIELIISEGYKIENIDNELLNDILKRVSSVIEIEIHNLNK